MFDVSI